MSQVLDLGDVCRLSLLISEALIWAASPDKVSFCLEAKDSFDSKVMSIFACVFTLQDVLSMTRMLEPDFTH